MVAGRTANCDWLMDRLGVDAGELHRRIVTEVRAMGHHKAEALRYAYGFDMTDKLRFTKYRREAYIATLDEWKSIDTIIGWEDDAIEELLKRLLSPTVDVPPSWTLSVSVFVDSIGRVEHVNLDVFQPDDHEANAPVRVSTPEIVGSHIKNHYYFRLPDSVLNLQIQELMMTINFRTPSFPDEVFAVRGASLATVQMAQGQQVVPHVTAHDRAFGHIFQEPQATEYFGLVWNALVGKLGAD